MASLFSAEEFAWLGRPHIARAWFLELYLPDRAPDDPWRLHNGVGRKYIGGQWWRGVSDPAGGQLVALSAVEDPQFGQAAKVDIELSGVNVDFLRSVKDTARDIEGCPANLYWCAFDQETQEVWPYGLKALFPGYISAPRIRWAGVGVRTVPFIIESLWHSQNFPIGGKWNQADQRRRYPGDKGLDYVGVKVQEVIK